MFRWRQLVLHEEMAVLEQIPDFVFYPLALTSGPLGVGRCWPATLCRQLPLGQFFAYLGYSAQDCLRQFFDDVKLADLVGNVAEYLASRLWIEGRSVGGDAL